MKYDKEVLQKALQEIKQWFERSTSPGWMEVGGEGAYDLIGLDKFGDPVEIVNQLVQEGFLRTRMLTEEEVRSNVGEGVEPFEVFELTNKKIGDRNMIKLKAKLKINDGKKVIDRDPFKNVTDELIWMAQSINTIKAGHIISEYQSTKPYEVLEVTDNPDSVELKVRNVSTGTVEMRSYSKHDGVDLLINRRTEKPHKMNDWYGDDEPRVGYYEVLWYEGETADEAARGDFLTKEFKDKSEALEFYNSIKDDSDKHMFWVSSRTRDGEFIDDIILEDEDGGNIIEQIPNMMKDKKSEGRRKAQDNLEEILYLRDRIYEYERKGIGSEEEYEAWKVKLEQLLDMEDNEEKHIYEFPELTDEDKEVLEDYDLTYLGHEGENCIVEGYWNDLDDYTQLYLGYEMKPERLHEPGEYQGKPKIEDEHENSWMTKEYQDELDREHEDDKHENSWMNDE